MSSGGRGHGRSKKAAHAEEHVNHERWLLTYADLITLLMVLFIVLFAIGQTDQKKFDKLAGGLATSLGNANQAIDGSSGLLPGAASVTGNSARDAPMLAQPTAATSSAAGGRDRARLDRAKALLEAALRKRGLAGAARFDLQGRGLVVTIVTDNVLFPSGSADLQARGRQVLDAISPVLRSLPNDVTIEGHTDDVPVSGRFASNWELSVGRATSVLHYLLDADRVSARRLSAAGYADQRPLVGNDSPAHRSRNRRVEVVVLALPLAAAPATAAKPVVAVAAPGSLAPDLAHSAGTGVTPTGSTPDPGKG